MQETPSQAISDWLAVLGQAEIPVLRRTEEELAPLREDVDRLSARQVAGVVLNDPLMACRLMVYMANHRRSQTADIETVERALMMIGVVRFVEDFGSLPTLEDALADQPEALVGALRVAARARRASRYAADWAALRHDLDVNEIAVAALLFDTTELLMWVFAPDKMLHMATRRKAEPTTRSATLQLQTFGFDFRELQYALAKAWNMPELLVRLMNDTQSTHPSVRTVMLAADFARHSANGWDDPALPDDIRAIGDLLKLQRGPLLERLKLDKTILALR